MKYTVEVGWGAVMYIPSFIKPGSAIQKLIKGDPQTLRKQDDPISILSFF
jgi:hypothetical protein